MLSLRLLLLALAAVLTARATTVIPPQFDELVASSEVVFRGRVTNVEMAWAGAGKARIVTRVTFAVERTLRGDAPPTMTLEFLGGSVGGRSLVVAGWPTFAVGNRGVFFVENRRSRICPLVRLRHGRYRIVEDGGGAPERVVRDDYTPVRTMSDVARPLREAPARAAAVIESVTLQEFETFVTERSAALPRPAVMER